MRTFVHGGTRSHLTGSKLFLIALQYDSNHSLGLGVRDPSLYQDHTSDPVNITSYSVLYYVIFTSFYASFYAVWQVQSNINVNCKASNSMWTAQL